MLLYWNTVSGLAMSPYTQHKVVAPVMQVALLGTDVQSLHAHRLENAKSYLGTTHSIAG